MNSHLITKAKNWYTDEAEFRQLCGDAQSQARSEVEQEFAAQMVLRANEYGLESFITPKQHTWLCRLADHLEPRMLK